MQIKEITIEIRDIKDRRKHSNHLENKTNINVRNYTLSGPLQEGHAKHDEGGVHYEDSVQTVHLLPDNMYSPEHCALIQCPSPKEPNASPLLLPELHPSSPSNETWSKPPSKKLPSSKSPNSPESPRIVEGNADEEGDPLCTKMNSCDNEISSIVDDGCKKVGV